MFRIGAYVRYKEDVVRAQEQGTSLQRVPVYKVVRMKGSQLTIRNERTCNEFYPLASSLIPASLQDT